jgi:hypothetical protein
MISEITNTNSDTNTNDKILFEIYNKIVNQIKELEELKKTNKSNEILINKLIEKINIIKENINIVKKNDK